jgi:hypothetical protein
VCKVPSLVFLVALVVLGSASALLAEPIPSKGQEPCKAATGTDSPVDKACREGGIPAAKATMKQLLRDGRKAGIKHECDDCHTADDDYSKLTKDAQEKLAKLLEAVAKQKP